MRKVILRSTFHGGRKLTLSYSLGSDCSKTTVWAQTVVTTVWDSLGSDCYSLSPRCKVVATAVASGGSTVVVTTAVAMPAAFLLPTRCRIPR